jgi:DNA-directed RNA polymerase subunit RPC12/RpoP
MPLQVKDVSVEGYEFKIHGDGSNFTLWLSNEITESWSIKGVKSEDAAFKCNRCGAIFESHRGMAEYFLATEPIKCERCGGSLTKFYPIIQEIASRFRFDGIEKTLGVKIGDKKVAIAMVQINNSRILFSRVASLINRVRMREVQEVLWEERPSQEFLPPPRRVELPQPRKELSPLPREQLGLGNEGRRRLRVLFESTLDGLSIKVTNSLRVRSEEVIYQLDAKYRFTPRTDAVEKAIIDFTKWIEENVYFKP